MNGIFMEAPPFLKGVFCVLVIFLVLPLQHARRVIQSNRLAIGLDDTGRVIQKIVGIHNADFYLRGRCVMSVGAVGAIRKISMVPILVVTVHTSWLGRIISSNLRTNDFIILQIIKDAAQLLIAGFGRHEIVEASHFVERRDRAAIVAGNTGPWMTDQEREMKFPKQGLRDNSRISRFYYRRIRMRRAFTLPIGFHGICGL